MNNYLVFTGKTSFRMFVGRSIFSAVNWSFCCRTREPSSLLRITATGSTFPPERFWRTRSSQETCGSSTTEAFWGKKKKKPFAPWGDSMMNSHRFCPFSVWSRSSASSSSCCCHWTRRCLLLSIKQVHYGTAEFHVIIYCVALIQEARQC